MRLHRYGLLLGVFLVCLLLLTVQTRGGETGRAADVVALLVTPIQGLLVKVHRGALGLWTTYVDWKSVRSENTVLRAEAERLKLQALQVEETRQENARLRRLLALRERLPLSALAGEVVGREAGGWVRTLTVNRGRGSGVARQVPVIVPEGLVGRIVQVSARASVVQLLNDPASTVEGVPIGRVAAIQDKGSALFHFAVLAPVVDFARVEEVLLLTGQTQQDMAGLFTPDG